MIFAGGAFRNLTTGVCLGALTALAAPVEVAAAVVAATVKERGADSDTARPYYSELAYGEGIGAGSGATAGGFAVAPSSSIASASGLARRAPVDRRPLQVREGSGPQLNTTGRTMVIVAPLKDREIFLGDVEVQIGADDSVQISVRQVFELLGRTLDPAVVESLRPLAEPGVFAPPSFFEEVGLPVTFDRRSLELAVAIPTSSRARRAIGLAELDRELYGEFASPEAFTAYLNMRGSVDYLHVGGDTGLGDPFVMLDGAARFGGVVLEAEGSWSDRENSLSRNGTRLVYDDIGRLNRWTVGDLVPQGRGFQGVQDMAGVSVTRSYAMMDPQRNVAPRGGRTFTLERDSTIEAFVNGRSIRTIRLQPGTYDVSDFPFVQGSNDVDLVIVDDTGRREVISFSLFIDRTQLAPGLSEYGFYAGVRSDRTGSDIDYSSDFTASGFYRYGVSETLTLGGNFQYGQDSGLVAGEVVWGGPWGTLGGDVAVSHLDSVGSGWAANFSYERLVQDTDGGTSFTATVEARSRRFGAVGQLAPDNPFRLNASVSVSRSFGDSSFVGAQARYALGRGAFEDERSVRVSYGRRIGVGMNVILDADWNDGARGEDVGFRVAFVRRFGASGSGRAEYDSRSDRARFGYQASGGRGVGAWSGSGNVDVGSDTYGLNAAGSYAANRADLGLAHSTAYSQVRDDITDQRTSLRVGTSIAYAGGSFAVGRPVSDGFVIVRPYRGARDVTVEVEPNPDGYYSRSGVLGPALYGQIGSYSPRTVTFDAPDAPAGFDVGQGALRLLPPYRAGYVVTVGSDYGVTAVGRLIMDNGEPLTLIAGTAVEIGGEGRRVDIFTNRQGQFGVGGLKAGRWRIEMPGEPPLVYELIVPDAPDGIIRAGDLRPIR